MAEWTSIRVPVSFKRSKPRNLSEGRTGIGGLAMKKCPASPARWAGGIRANQTPSLWGYFEFMSHFQNEPANLVV